MKRLRFLLLPLACVLSVAAAGCGGKAPERGASTSGPKDTHVTKFKLGHDLDKDGEAVREGRSFSKGDKVCVSFAIVDAQHGAQARAVWVTKAGAKMGEETKPLPSGDRVVGFTAETKNWEPGTYMVETWVVESGVRGVRSLGSADFSVVESQPK